MTEQAISPLRQRMIESKTCRSVKFAATTRGPSCLEFDPSGHLPGGVIAGDATKYQPQPSVFTNPAGTLVSVISTQLEAIMIKIIHALRSAFGLEHLTKRLNR
jgi:hypothetical protein